MQKKRDFGLVNWSVLKISQFTARKKPRRIRVWAEYCELEPDCYNNAWTRKTYSGARKFRIPLLVSLTLGDMNMAEERAMSVTWHGSALQMRKDYDGLDTCASGPHPRDSNFKECVVAPEVVPQPGYHPSGRQSGPS